MTTQPNVNDLIEKLNELLTDEKQLSDFLANDANISQLSNEQLEMVLQKTSYYNNYIPAEKKWALVSVTNWEEQYMRKFTMSSLVGWLYRALEEWDPTENAEENTKMQGIARQFLDRHLNYNPDKHVKGHHKKKFVKKPEMMVWEPTYVKDNAENLDVKQMSLKESTMELVTNTMEKIPAVFEKNVPSDAFYHWNRYIEVNFEELHLATCELYDVLPDLKWSVAFWDSFDREEKATDAKNKWRDSIKIPLDIIENNGHTLMGPWKTNREAIDYHNKNTELLKRMQDQLKADQKLGEDIMKKNIRVRKAANIKEVGGDDPGLQTYMKALNTIDTLGCKATLTKEEKLKLEMAHRAKDDEETPNDAVGVDVFSVKTDIDTGAQDVTRKRLYTKADSPEDVAEQNRLREAYFERKLIKDSNGNMVPLSDIQKQLAELTAAAKNNIKNNDDEHKK
jgi:hypothetical protein